MIPGSRRAQSTDIAVVTPQDQIELALEFKYEPCHRRLDILKQKLPVVVWGIEGVANDLERIRQYVSCGKAKAARSYFLDEGGYFAHRPAHSGSVWISWGGNRCVLESRASVATYVMDKIMAGERSLVEEGEVPHDDVEMRFG
jgi:hypothetical protein